MSKSVGLRQSEDYSFGKKMLAKQAFRLVILTTVFGLLPVTWHGDRVTYSACSLSTLYSIVLLLTMMYLSVIFTSMNVGVPPTISLSATDMAVQVLRFTHVLGFLTLVIRGYRIAKSMPKVWSLLATLMQSSFRYPERWMKSQRIIGKYARICIIFFTIVILLKEFIIVMVQRDDIVGDFIHYYGGMKHGWQYWVVLFSYIIWDFTTLCHGLVSMLLTLFLVMLEMCLKSINHDIKLLSESCVLDAGGGNRGGSHSNSIATIDTLEFDAFRQLEQEVNEIRKNYRHVEEILGKLSWSFGASVVVEQLIVTGTLISNLFFLYMAVFNAFRGCSGEYNYSARVPIVDVVAHSFFFICLTSASSRVTKRSRKSMLILKRIPTDLNSSAVQILLRELIGDIASSRILLTASDCFIVNTGLLQTVLSSVVTFTLVLVQFQYQERDFSGCQNPNSTLVTPP